MATQPNKQKEAAGVKELIAGAEKRFQNTSSLAFGGATYTLPELTKLLTSYVGLIGGVDAAKVAYQEKLKVLREQAPTARTTIRAFKAYVRATFGNSPDALADFGLKPHKAPLSKSVETKTAAVQKSQATRVARHTMGAKQRKAIKGTPAATAHTGTAVPMPTTTVQNPPPPPATTKVTTTVDTPPPAAPTKTA